MLLRKRWSHISTKCLCIYASGFLLICWFHYLPITYSSLHLRPFMNFSNINSLCRFWMSSLSRVEPLPSLLKEHSWLQTITKWCDKFLYESAVFFHFCTLFSQKVRSVMLDLLFSLMWTSFFLVVVYVQLILHSNSVKSRFCESIFCHTECYKPKQFCWVHLQIFILQIIVPSSFVQLCPKFESLSIAADILWVRLN